MSESNPWTKNTVSVKCLAANPLPAETRRLVLVQSLEYGWDVGLHDGYHLLEFENASLVHRTLGQ